MKKGLAGWGAKILAGCMSAILMFGSLPMAMAADMGPGGPPPGGPGGAPGGDVASETAELLIHCVYGGGVDNEAAAGANSFIELFNNSGESIDLDGYTLEYATDTGIDQTTQEEHLNTKTLTLSGAVPAYSSFLIRCDETGADAGLSCGGDLIWNQAISDTTYQIVLKDGDEQVTDAVAVGQSALYTEGEGDPISSAISATTLIVRTELSDTDNNADDFSVQTLSAATAPRSTEDGIWTILKDFSITVGTAAGEINVTWLSTTADTAGFLFDGEDLSAQVVTAAATGDSAAAFYTNKITIDGLSDKTYAYTYGNDGVNNTGSYTPVQTSGDSFSFLVVGDPQLGASGDAQSDAEGWYDTLSTALSNGTAYSFLYSMGDQVESSTSEAQYDLFLDAAELTGIALAPTVGNHDNGKVDYAEHFTTPNESEYGETADGNGDYWFAYGNTLFLNLNTNNSSVSAHKAFMEDAIAAVEQQQTITWKVVTFHQSIFSVASHVSDVATLRTNLAPVLNALDIDVVLQGHDHVYARSYIMGGSEDETGMVALVTDTDLTTGQSELYAPDGVQYVTFNSASGSKYYNITSEAYSYTDVQDQSKQPNYSAVTVTDTSFTVTTYKINGNTTETVDSFTIYNFSDKDYVSGYATTDQTSGVGIVESDLRAALLSWDESSASAASANAAANNGEQLAYLLPISEQATELSVDVSKDGTYYAMLEVYDASGVRCGGSLGWTAPGSSQSADLTSNTYSAAAYYTVVVKNGSTGSIAVGNDIKSFVSVSVLECDEHISYGTAVYENAAYTYVEIDGLTPSVFAPNGAAANDETNVLGMAELYGEENQIVVAANAGIFYNNSANTYGFQYKEADGVLISNGTVLKSTESIDHTQCDILVVDADGELGWAPFDADADKLAAGTYDETTYYTVGRTNQRGSASIVSAVTGFVPILTGGELVEQYDNDVAHYRQSAVRQIIGVKADGTYLLMSGTWTLAEAAGATKAAGCVFAYNLDGGGSAETVLGQTATEVVSGATSYAASDLVAQSRGDRTLPTYLVFTADDEAPVSAAADSLCAVPAQSTYRQSVTLAELAEDLTVTETLNNANGATSTRTVYSALAVDSTATLTHVLLSGSTLETATAKSTITAPNGTLYHTKTATEITACLSSNGNTRESEAYYDYSTGYTLTASGSLSTAGTKTITVCYAGLSTTYDITIAADVSGAPVSTAYAVKVDSNVENGTVTADRTSAAQGVTVTLTVTPNAGYTIAGVTVTDAGGKSLAVTYLGSGTFSYLQPSGASTVTASFTATSADWENPFEDVASESWYYAGVIFVYRAGLFSGVSAKSFAPTAAMTRQQMWMVLARLSGQAPSSMAEARTWAMEAGISDGSNPNAAVTRQQFVTLLWRQAGSPDANLAVLTNYTDAEVCADYARTAVAWAVSNGILTGSDGKLLPKNGATRAQIVMILSRCAL